MPRYSASAEFFLDAENPADASVIVGNFIDSFPSQIGDEHDGDVILQDVEEA